MAFIKLTDERLPGISGLLHHAPHTAAPLLLLAQAVQTSGKSVTPEEIGAAKGEGATDAEIHDTVLIAAAFCMFNRYVDGLGTSAPAAPEEYLEMGERMANMGYVRR